MMVEASLLPNQAALKVNDKLRILIEVQKEEMQLWERDAKVQQEGCQSKLLLMKIEGKSTA
jgi:hypothetical protein